MFKKREQTIFVNMVIGDIIHTALENLKNNTHIEGIWNKNALDKGTYGAITFDIDNKKVRVVTGVKKTLRAFQVEQIVEIARVNKPFLLVAEHIFPNLKEELRKREIGYLEANGNIYLKQPGMHLWIDTQKPMPQKKDVPNRAFTKTGLKAVFQLLLNEEVVNYPYRDIARISGISLGNVTNVINGLKQAGFLLNLNEQEFKLVNKKVLLEKWMVTYAERLKPTLHIGTFRFLHAGDFNKWKEIVVTPGMTYWGGEAGGEKYTRYLKPEILTMYTHENRNELIRNYKLVPDEQGNVTVYQKFWNNDNGLHDTAPPLLVYADLMNTGGDRCIETAKKIYNEALQDKF